MSVTVPGRRKTRPHHQARSRERPAHDRYDRFIRSTGSSVPHRDRVVRPMITRGGVNSSSRLRPIYSSPVRQSSRVCDYTDRIIIRGRLGSGIGGLLGTLYCHVHHTHSCVRVSIVCSDVDEHAVVLEFSSRATALRVVAALSLRVPSEPTLCAHDPASSSCRRRQQCADDHGYAFPATISSHS